jgi:hypothetical protein
MAYIPIVNPTTVGISIKTLAPSPSLTYAFCIPINFGWTQFMPLQFDKPPLSIFKEIKSGSKLYFANWLKLLPYGIIFALISPILREAAILFTKQLEGEHVFTGPELALEILLAAALSLLSVFLVLNIAYQTKSFVDKTSLSFKEMIINTASKIAPIFITALIMIIIFGMFSGTSALILIAAISQVENWQSIANQVWATVWVVLSLVAYIWAISLLIRASQYSLAILFENKTMLESIRYSFSLVRGWRSIIGTFLLLLIIQLVSLFASVIIPDLFESIDYLQQGLYFVLVSFVFPWSVVCMLCWFWHLQKHRVWE